MVRVLLAVKDLEADQGCTQAFLHVFLGAAIKPFIMLRAEKKERILWFCFLFCFVVLETHIYS